MPVIDWRPFDEGWYDALRVAAGTGTDRPDRRRGLRAWLRREPQPSRDYRMGYRAANAFIRYQVRHGITRAALTEWIDASIVALGRNRTRAVSHLIAEAEHATRQGGTQ